MENWVRKKIQYNACTSTVKSCSVSSNFLMYSAWEDGCHSPYKKIPCLLQIPKTNYSVRKNSPTKPILNYMNPVHTLFFKLHFNISFPTMPRSSKWPFPSGFWLKSWMHFLISPMHAISHPPWTDCSSYPTSSSSFCFLFLRSKYSPQPILLIWLKKKYTIVICV